MEARLGTLARREARAVVGKTSGGYGALVHGARPAGRVRARRPHARDSCFEYCYLPTCPRPPAALVGAPDAAAWLDGAKRRAARDEARAGPITRR